MPENRFLHISTLGEMKRFASAKEALSYKNKNGFLWLDYCKPQSEDLNSLMEPLGIHPLAIEDCLDESQIPKIEDYPNHLFMLFNTFQYAHKTLAVQEVDFLISNDFLLTVSNLDINGNCVLKNIEQKISQDIESVKNGPAFLAHSILDWIVDEKFTAIEAIEEDLNNAEDNVISDYEAFSPSELVHLRRELLTLRKSLFHEREVLIKICRKDSQFIPEKSIYQYRDIYDHLAKFFELTESARDVVTSLMEMYLSMLNNQMTRAANRTNEIVRRLTFITTIFMPLSLLAGIGGMSEWSMMTGPENWKISYPVFLAIMLIIGIMNYFLLKWMERKDK